MKREKEEKRRVQEEEVVPFTLDICALQLSSKLRDIEHSVVVLRGEATNTQRGEGATNREDLANRFDLETPEDLEPPGDLTSHIDLATLESDAARTKSNVRAVAFGGENCCGALLSNLLRRPRNNTCQRASARGHARIGAC